MAINVNAQHVKSEKDLGTPNRPLPGRYHVVINRVDESEQEYPNKVVVDFEVRAGTTPNQEGRVAREFFATTSAAMDRLIKLGLCTGLLKPGESKDVEFSRALGCQLVIDVEPHSYTDKNGQTVETTCVAFLGIHKPDDRSVADVPKDPQLAQLYRGDPATQTPVDVPRPSDGGTQTGGDDDDEWAQL